MHSDYTTIRVSAADGIGHIMLDRPRALNAFNAALMAEVTTALRAFEADRAIRAVVLSGEGRAFSAGFDLKEAAVNNYTTAVEWRGAIEADFDFIMQFWDCRKPTIAAGRSAAAIHVRLHIARTAIPSCPDLSSEWDVAVVSAAIRASAMPTPAGESPLTPPPG